MNHPLRHSKHPQTPHLLRSSWGGQLPLQCKTTANFSNFRSSYKKRQNQKLADLKMHLTCTMRWYIRLKPRYVCPFLLLFVIPHFSPACSLPHPVVTFFPQPGISRTLPIQFSFPWCFLSLKSVSSLARPPCYTHNPLMTCTDIHTNIKWKESLWRRDLGVMNGRKTEHLLHSCWLTLLKPCSLHWEFQCATISFLSSHTLLSLKRQTHGWMYRHMSSLEQWNFSGKTISQHELRNSTKLNLQT